MKIQVFLDVMLCRWINNSRRFERLGLPLGLNMKKIKPLKTLETIFERDIYQLTPGNIPEDPNLSSVTVRNSNHKPYSVLNE
jgi:hypothetical protein